MLPKPKGDFINGRFVNRRQIDGRVISIDPSSERKLEEYPTYDAAVSEAVEAARQAFAGWAATPLDQRITGLRKLKAQLINRGEELALVMAQETGRPCWETRQEVLALREQIDVVVRMGLAELSLTRQPGPGSTISARPRGIVAILAAATQPARLMHHDVVAALAVGCTVVCKPSAATPGSGQLYAELVHEADLPRGCFNLIQGDDDCGQRLAAADVDVVLFSGSHRAAQALEHTITTQRIPPLCRLNASATPLAIVLDDANLDQAVSEVAIGACLSSGQRCTNTRAVLVHRRAAARLEERLVATLSQLRVAAAEDPTAFAGPMRSYSAKEDYERHLKRWQSIAEEIDLERGAAVQTMGFFVRPALFRATSEMLPSLLEEELAGPLLAMVVIENLEEGVALARRRRLRGIDALFTRSEQSIAEAIEARSGGGLMVNGPTTAWPLHLPLESRGVGGCSVPAGVLTARFLTTISATMQRDGNFDSTMLPPGISSG